MAKMTSSQMKEEARKLFFEGAITDEPLEYLSISEKIESWKPVVRTEIEKELEEPLLILDESLRFIFALSEHYGPMAPEVHMGAFEIQLSKISSDIISIRELILLGQSSAAKSVARSFLEDIEVTMAILIDGDFADAYTDPNIQDFWSKYIGYGKIKKHINEFISRAGNDEDQIRFQLQRHRELKTYLSSYVHANFHSSLSTAFPQVVDRPGLFKAFPLGAFEYSMVPLCLAVSEIVHHFSACFINIMISKNPSPLIAVEHRGATFNNLISSAYVLQELVTEHAPRLYEEYESSVNRWDTESDDKGNQFADV